MDTLTNMPMSMRAATRTATLTNTVMNMSLPRKWVMHTIRSIRTMSRTAIRTIIPMIILTTTPKIMNILMTMSIRMNIPTRC